MPEPRIAPVRPRISAPSTGEPILLEDYVATLIDKQRPFVLKICGELGDGKRTALRHLAATTFSARPVFLEGSDRVGSASDADERFVVRVLGSSKSDESVYLLPWTNDDLIEYLLSVDGADVADVMARCQALDVVASTGGKPGICRVVIDTLTKVDDSTRETVSDCIRAGIRSLLPNDRQYAKAQRHSLGLALMRGLPKDVGQLLGLRRVQIALAAERVLIHVGRKRLNRLPVTLHFDLLPEVVALAEKARVTTDDLLRHLQGRNSAFFASMLHAIDPDWRPDAHDVRLLKNAILSGASWAEADLSGINAQRADLQSSDLCGTVIQGGYLDRATLTDCNFTGADISDTTFLGARLQRANFRRADLYWCSFGEAVLASSSFQAASLKHVNFDFTDLTDCSFVDAKLNCRFRGATLDGADFTGCQSERSTMVKSDLRETRMNDSSWTNCTFQECDFEFMRITKTSFWNSRLDRSYLSGSKMRDVDFSCASLCQTGLADIDWQGVDLRDADLSGCAFHMGSSRSGLVGSPYPGHGSKTGFYTNDFDDIWHRPVEEIRKANLAGADLRGANINNTDFYLVDLRGALYDKDQYDHFVRCDAILTDRHG